MFEQPSTTDVFNVGPVEVWKSLSAFDCPDYEISDMGRVRCIKDRKGHKAPFFPATKIRDGRPVIVMRDRNMKQVSHRIDELVLQAFHGLRPGPSFGASPINGDKLDVRADNLTWAAGLRRANANSPKRIRRVKKTTKKPVKIAKEIKHGHWLGTGNVMVSVQPSGVIELTVGDQEHHSVPVTDLDDVIRVLQAAKTIIEG